jgi:hypothetical protein
MPDERIMTLHPQGKAGVNICKEKYQQIRNAIVGSLEGREALTFRELMEQVGQALEGKFEGSIGCYVTTVKLDLEARGTIERLPGASPQQLRLAQNAQEEVE